MKIKKYLAVILSMIFLCAGFIGCKSESTAEKNDNGQSKNIVFGVNQFPSSLDPAEGFNGWFVSMYGVGETLVKLDKNMKIEPLLADSWKRVNDLTWKFHIKDGAKFQDGTPVNGKTVKASLERSLKLNPRAESILLIDSITEDGQYVSIKTKTPYEAFLGNIADPVAIIVNTSAAKDTFTKAPVCTGPFKVKSYVPDSKVVVEKNKNYWGDEAKIDGAAFKYIKDANTRAMALQSGEIDAAQSISSDNISLFADKSKYNTDKITSLRIIMSYENLNNEFLKDPAVRKAIALGVNRESYAKDVLKGTAEAAVGPFPKSLPFGEKKLTAYKYDKEGAVKFLNEAGYTDTDGDGIREKNGKKLELNLAFYTSRSELPVIAQAMQSELKEIGIAVKLQSYESVANVLKSGSFDLCLYSVNTATSGDPQSFLELYFKTGGSENYGKYSNPEVDSLIDELKNEKDTQKRNDIAIDVQKKLLEDNSDIFLVTPMLNLVSKSNVSGLTMYPVDYYLLNSSVDIK